MPCTHSDPACALRLPGPTSTPPSRSVWRKKGTSLFSSTQKTVPQGRWESRKQPVWVCCVAESQWCTAAGARPHLRETQGPLPPTKVGATPQPGFVPPPSTLYNKADAPALDFPCKKHVTQLLLTVAAQRRSCHQHKRAPHHRRGGPEHPRCSNQPCPALPSWVTDHPTTVPSRQDWAKSVRDTAWSGWACWH